MCLLLVACAMASWQSIDVAPGYKAPKRLTIHISGPAQWSEVTRALSEALLQELASEDIVGTLIEGNGQKTDVEVSIEDWDKGSRALRWVASGAAGAARMEVQVTYSADGRLLVDGHAVGRINAGFFGGSATDAARAAGKLIAEALATGEGKPDPALQTQSPDADEHGDPADIK